MLDVAAVPAPPVWTATPAPPQATQGVLYTYDVSSLVDNAPSAYALLGAWPTGFSISAAGVITGTPDTVTTYTGLTIQATNADGSATSGLFDLLVTPGLDIVGYLAFDEGAGLIAYDASVNGYNGILSGGMNDASWVAGRQGTALMFDGIDDHVDLGDVLDFATPADFSLVAWINPTTIDTSDQRTFMSKWGGATSDRAFRFEIEKDKTITVLLDGASANINSSTVLATDTWYHVVLTVSQSADEVRLYVNGVQEDANLSWNGTLADSAAPFNIGRLNNGSQAFNGVIDEVRVYDRVLSATDVVQLWQ